MAKRKRAESKLGEPRSVQGGVVAVAMEELAQATFMTGKLPVNEGRSLLAGDGLLHVAAEDGLYSHPFWAFLIRVGYTPL